MRTLPPCTSDRARGSGPLGDLARLRNLAGFPNCRGLTAQATAVTLLLQKRQPQLDSLSTCEFPRELCNHGFLDSRPSIRFPRVDRSSRISRRRGLTATRDARRHQVHAELRPRRCTCTDLRHPSFANLATRCLVPVAAWSLSSPWQCRCANSGPPSACVPCSSCSSTRTASPCRPSF
eukprot:COSAG02_NODE_3302_length_6981_cov_6.817640_7_plen_178_part_00